MLSGCPFLPLSAPPAQQAQVLGTRSKRQPRRSPPSLRVRSLGAQSPARTPRRQARGAQPLPGEAPRRQARERLQTARSPPGNASGSVADPHLESLRGGGNSPRLRRSPLLPLRAAEACMQRPRPKAQLGGGREIQLLQSLPPPPRARGLSRGWRSPFGCRNRRPGTPLTRPPQGRQLLRPPPSCLTRSWGSCRQAPTQGPLQQLRPWTRRHRWGAPPQETLAPRKLLEHGR